MVYLTLGKHTLEFEDKKHFCLCILLSKAQIMECSPLSSSLPCICQKPHKQIPQPVLIICSSQRLGGPSTYASCVGGAQPCPVCPPRLTIEPLGGAGLGVCISGGRQIVASFKKPMILTRAVIFPSTCFLLSYSTCHYCIGPISEMRTLKPREAK